MDLMDYLRKIDYQTAEFSELYDELPHDYFDISGTGWLGYYSGKHREA